MATWRSPSTIPVHIVLLSGHAVVIGPEGRELLPLFESAALAAGCVLYVAPPEPKRRRRPSNTVEAVEAVEAIEAVEAVEAIEAAPSPLPLE